ncbi:DUF167 domain-containing protein [Candidatus Babeliales bacterium]|nr:DUF167 domain-containing protein [Candidatus Babeliales bacterium]
MSLIIELKVVPQSGKLMLILDKSGMLKAFLKAAPEDGKANKELIELIANFVNVTKKSVEIIKGLTSRKKKLAIDTSMSYQQFLLKLTGGVQKKIF